MFSSNSDQKSDLKLIADGCDIVEKSAVLNRAANHEVGQTSRNDLHEYFSHIAAEISPDQQDISAIAESGREEMSKWFYGTFDDVH